MTKRTIEQSQLKQTWPHRYHEQIHVSHLLRCHVMFTDHAQVRHLSEHGRPFRLRQIVLSTAHCVEVWRHVPTDAYVSGNCAWFKGMYLKDCHTRSHGFTDSNLLSCMLVHIAITRIESKEVKYKDYHTELVLIWMTDSLASALTRLNAKQAHWPRYTAMQ
jgi:hypothetical protein